MNMDFGHDDRRIAIFAKGCKCTVKCFRFNIDAFYSWGRIHNSNSKNINNDDDDDDDDNGLLAFYKRCLFYATVLAIKPNYKVPKTGEL